MVQSSSSRQRLPQGSPMNQQQAIKLIVVLVMIAVFVVGFLVTRSVLSPVDRLVTNLACSGYGDRLSRPVLEYEPAQPYRLFDRNDGFCLYGPAERPDEGDVIEEEIEDPVILPGVSDSERVQLGVSETEPGSLYRLLKVLFVLLPLGGGSFATRVIGEPVLDRLVRPPE